MASRRVQITLPDELVKEIDSLVGSRGSSAFFAETARAELRRRKLLSFLRSEIPVWQAKDHPEPASGSRAWVRSLRNS
jgi:Arc/MetJ-type ribon-helix-helix transcriptional regulator